MKKTLSSNIATFVANKNYYMFNINNNHIQEISPELFEIINLFKGKTISTEEFYSKLNDDIISESIFRYLTDSGIIVDEKTVKTTSLPTMFGSEFSLISDILNSNINNIVFLGFPYDLGVTYISGQKFAPQKLRETSLSLYNCNFNFKTRDMSLNIPKNRIKDIGDINGIVFEKNGSEFYFMENLIYTLITTGNFPVVIGGDHSISYSTILGASKCRKIGVIHIDAHDDFSILGKSNLKNKIHHGNFLGGIVEEDNIEHIYSIGVRALTNNICDHSKISYIDYDNLGEIDINLPYYITLDVDVINPIELRGVGTPVPGGVCIDKLIYLLENIINKFNIIGLDLVEFIPNDRIDCLNINYILLKFINFYSRKAKIE